MKTMYEGAKLVGSKVPKDGWLVLKYPNRSPHWVKWVSKSTALVIECDRYGKEKVYSAFVWFRVRCAEDLTPCMTPRSLRFQLQMVIESGNRYGVGSVKKLAEQFYERCSDLAKGISGRLR